jgi:4-hydroxybenzoate polyprenyltransferase
VADGIGLYIVGVTWFARTEAVESSRPSLVLSTLVMLCGIGLLAWYPNWNSFTGPDLNLPEHWIFFWIMLAGLVGMRCGRAIIDPSPRMVQVAVKTSIMSLILLDAAAATPLGDPTWAFTIVALLVPSMFLGRWIYST